MIIFDNCQRNFFPVLFFLSSLPLQGGGLTVYHSFFLSWPVVLITVTPPLVKSYSRQYLGCRIVLQSCIVDYMTACITNLVRDVIGPIYSGYVPFHSEGYLLRNSIFAMVRFKVARSSTCFEELGSRILNPGLLKVTFLRSESSPSELSGPGKETSFFSCIFLQL